MTTFLDDEIGRVPGESVIPVDWVPVQAANPAWTLTGDVWETVTTEETTTLEWVGDVPLTPRMSYVMTVEAQADADIALRWLIHQTYYDGGTLVLGDGAANIDPTTLVTAGAWVEAARAWDAPEGVVSGHFITEVTAPIGTTIQLRAPFAAPLDGPLQIRAGAISAETINGGAFTGETFTGGEFVGGEFRTSDALPGQVTLADDAWTDSWTGEVKPGIRVDPVDASATVIAPGIGPEADGIKLDGGSDTDGNKSHLRTSPAAALMRSTAADGAFGIVQTAPDFSLMKTTSTAGAGRVETAPGYSLMASNRPDGTTASDVQTTLLSATVRANAPTGTGRGLIMANPASAYVRTYSGNGSESGYVMANPTSAELAAVSTTNQFVSRIYADPTEAFLGTNADGTSRYLTADADGIWVKTNASGSWKSYNLEQTATMPAPEFVPYEFDASWDSASSPMGAVLVTHSTTGRHCQSRVRFNRRGTSFAITTTNTSIGRVIPTSTRMGVSMVDYIPVTFPGGVAGELVTDYQFGHVYLRTLTGTATMAPGDFVYATLSWFLPN